MRVVQYGVHDPGYPRNARLRSFLVERLGADVTVLVRARVGGRVRRIVADVAGLWRASRGADVIVLSEFRLTHAPLVWAVARLRGARFVVDHFVGLHETVIEDWRRAAPGGLTARRLAAQDALAARLADVCLTDTAPRAERLTAQHSRPVLALPVGAPAWARPTPLQPAEDGALRVLYYGNYIPLHGVDIVVQVLAELARSRPFVATFIGDGPDRRAIELAVTSLGYADRCRFLDPVAEAELARHIEASDVVLGVFGTSQKAMDVVPNKVWQGLACGRLTVTGDGPAVRALAPVAGDQLVLVDRQDPAAAARAISAAVGASRQGSFAGLSDVDVRLEQFTQQAFERFAAELTVGAPS